MSKSGTFFELYKASLKSKDTEEWIDIVFTRPIGLVFALLWNKLGIHPNVITILSIFLGIGAGVMFYFTDIYHNLLGILLLVLANLCDSTDGQMARLSGKTSLVGRILDGLSGDVWFFSIYLALCLRLQGQTIPGTTTEWGIWIWLLAILSGALSHSPQSSLADYYRQVHLFFLNGRNGSELDTSEEQKALADKAKAEGKTLEYIFRVNYAGYCRSQEKRTPEFQKLYKVMNEKGIDAASADSPQEKSILETLRDVSRPLMPNANFLSFNSRAIILYITCLLNIPWLYMLIEITVYNMVYMYMRNTHETFSKKVCKIIEENYAGKGVYI